MVVDIVVGGASGNETVTTWPVVLAATQKLVPPQASDQTTLANTFSGVFQMPFTIAISWPLSPPATHEIIEEQATLVSAPPDGNRGCSKYQLPELPWPR
jgi:hypothetical protein